MSPRFFFHSDSLITHARTISSRFLSKSESDIPSGKANVSKITNIVRFDFRRISLFYATSSFTTTLCHALRNDLNAIPPPPPSSLSSAALGRFALLRSSGWSPFPSPPNGSVKTIEGGETCIYNNGHNFLVLEDLSF